MFSCCDITYAKYINEDGTIDEEARKKAIEERFPSWNQTEIRRVLSNRYCRCICHQKGRSVIH